MRTQRSVPSFIMCCHHCIGSPSGWIGRKRTACLQRLRCRLWPLDQSHANQDSSISELRRRATSQHRNYILHSRNFQGILSDEYRLVSLQPRALPKQTFSPLSILEDASFAPHSVDETSSFSSSFSTYYYRQSEGFVHLPKAHAELRRRDST